MNSFKCFQSTNIPFCLFCFEDVSIKLVLLSSIHHCFGLIFIQNCINTKPSVSYPKIVQIGFPHFHTQIPNSNSSLVTNKWLILVQLSLKCSYCDDAVCLSASINQCCSRWQWAAIKTRKETIIMTWITFSLISHRN